MYWREHVAGVDEVGRGPLAGAVYAAAVVLDPFRPIAGLRDSKALSEKKREQLDQVVRREAVSFCVARAEVDEIDELNILHASMLAMQRAVEGLSCFVDFALIDGNRVPVLDCPAEWLVKGDARSDVIKAASIIAKVARDRDMVRLDGEFPGYGLATHKGYPTKQHMAALRELGPSPVHRMSFAPCREADLVRRSARDR